MSFLKSYILFVVFNDKKLKIEKLKNSLKNTKNMSNTTKATIQSDLEKLIVEHKINEDDIQLIMLQETILSSKRNRKEVVLSLIRNNYDIIETILELSF